MTCRYGLLVMETERLCNATKIFFSSITQSETNAMTPISKVAASSHRPYLWKTLLPSLHFQCKTIIMACICGQVARMRCMKSDIFVGKSEWMMPLARHKCRGKVKCNIKKIYIYNTAIHNFIFYQIILDYNSSYMFRPNCRTIFRLIFEQVECKLIMLSIYEISHYENWLK